MTPDPTAATPVPIDHAHLVAWCASPHFDKAMAAMSAHARSKKPGRVERRIAKHLERGTRGGAAVFAAPRVLRWTKASKFVLATAITRGAVGDIATTAARYLPDDAVIRVRTDLHLRATDEVTQADANSVSAVAETLADWLDEAAVDGVDPDGATRALARLRLFAIAAPRPTAATPETPAALTPGLDLLVPLNRSAAGAWDVLQADVLGVPRTEYGEAVQGVLPVAWGVLEVSAPDAVAHLDALDTAMAAESYPGAGAFAELVRENVRYAQSLGTASGRGNA